MAIYYVDSINGSNDFDGLSADKAFRNFEKINEMTLDAGDKILLKRDSVFSDALTVNGSGDVDAPIVISAYGEGLKKPAIITEGEPYAALQIKGECITIDGLEIENRKGRCGIYSSGDIHGAIRNITITSCYIHDVWVDNNLPPRPASGGWHHHHGGIIIETNTVAPTWYENAHIENNTIVNVNRTGIWFGGKWFNRFKNSFPWTANKAEGMDDEWWPHKNVYIAWNVVDHAHGDGIIGIGCLGLLMEHNRMYYANCGSRNGNCNAGLWSMACDGAVIQYNEVAYTGMEYGGDGEGYDIDNCSRNTIFQYNYSHHNEGGFLLICNITCNSADSHINNIARNNLSVNDANKTDSPIFTITGSMRNFQLLNNTIYSDLDNRYRLFQVVDYGNTGLADDVLIANNIFYSKERRNWNNFRSNGKFTFDSNIFYNMPALPEKDNIIDIDNNYELEPAVIAELSVPFTRLATNGFVPLWDSPLIRMGKHFDACADKDFRGLDAKGHNYIGAFYYKDANLG